MLETNKIDSIIECKQSGMTNRATAKHVGCSAGTVSKYWNMHLDTPQVEVAPESQQESPIELTPLFVVMLMACAIYDAGKQFVVQLVQSHQYRAKVRAAHQAVSLEMRLAY